MRLDRFLETIGASPSRSQAQNLIRQGRISVNGSVVKKSGFMVDHGHAITIEPTPTDQNPDPLPFESVLPLSIPYEDDHLLVIDKPAGIPMHRSPGHTSGTLVDRVLAKVQSLSEGSSPERPGVVHRLDKDTSGLVVMAKDNFTHRHLTEQFQNRSILRAYFGLCFGIVPFESKTITSQLARHPKDRKRFSSTTRPGHGKQAITTLRRIVVSPTARATLCEFKLQTGRTHQIRVHSSEARYPLYGDRVYGSPKPTNPHLSKPERAALEILESESRFFLHAHTLGFLHPRTQKQLTFHSSLPAELQRVLTTLEIHL